MDEASFVVSKEDWSLHRKGHQDQTRHQEKVREAIRKNLPDLVSEESIIMSNGRDVVKIPIRSLDEYRFRFNYQKGQHTGQGKGDSKVGDVIAKGGDPAQGAGKGSGAGDQPGADYYEAEITVEELEEILFSELELPNLEQKDRDEIIVEETRFNDVRKKGLMGNIDKKRTLLAAIRRNALAGYKDLELGISDEDLRFKTWEEVIKPHSNAVIIAMMDTSGSMGIFEKYIARSFFFWMLRFLRTRYEKVEIAFIAHHTEAKEVTEDAFFSKGESGGTICSSAYRKALEIIDSRYPPSQYNIYPFHFSDGDNLTSDNERCVKLVKELMERCNMFGYGEVNQ
ncbi:sporulation protein YhbH [Brevibacillus humidisoli]|uniref:sporulation protein YhbH n=1 Tax=Brevibacillus humidisoli TaxID=2895522 RepID=UPI001E48BBF7|nr:sporulation protein YhbH [Brevibacillus humidisoli]UFJ41314.1 sporulation protein YhbH [Brevibacillus humidisoli]